MQLWADGSMPPSWRCCQLSKCLADDLEERGMAASMHQRPLLDGDEGGGGEKREREALDGINTMLRRARFVSDGVVLGGGFPRAERAVGGIPSWAGTTILS